MTEEATKAEAEEAAEDITTLGDVFNDEPEPEKEPESEKGEAEPAKTDDKSESEPPAEGTTSQDEAQVKIEALQKQVQAFKTKAIAETKKRQEVEKQIPDPIEEPEAYADHVKSESTSNELNLRINLTRDVYMDLKDDFAEKEAVFLKMVMGDDGEVIDPHLVAKFQESSNPAKFAYDTASEKMKLDEVSSPDFVEKLKQSLREDILKELEEDAKKTKATDVPDLTTATAKGGNSEPEEAPLTLSNVFS